MANKRRDSMTSKPVSVVARLHIVEMGVKKKLGDVIRRFVARNHVEIHSKVTTSKLYKLFYSQHELTDNCIFYVLCSPRHM